MARELRGPTLGGDFIVQWVDLEGDQLRVGMEFASRPEYSHEPGEIREVATLVLDVAKSRFAVEPSVGDRYRVALETTKVQDSYGDQREPRATVAFGFLDGVEQLLSEAVFNDEDYHRNATQVVESIAAMRSHLQEAESRDA